MRPSAAVVPSADLVKMLALCDSMIRGSAHILGVSWASEWWGSLEMLHCLFHFMCRSICLSISGCFGIMLSCWTLINKFLKNTCAPLFYEFTFHATLSTLTSEAGLCPWSYFSIVTLNCIELLCIMKLFHSQCLWAFGRRSALLTSEIHITGICCIFFFCKFWWLISQKDGMFLLNIGNICFWTWSH